MVPKSFPATIFLNVTMLKSLRPFCSFPIYTLKSCSLSSKSSIKSLLSNNPKNLFAKSPDLNSGLSNALFAPFKYIEQIEH